MRVSVVIATRNRCQLLPRAVETALGAADEVVIVDDASTDDTPAVVQQLRARGDIRYVRLNEIHGPAAARNFGIEIAKGEVLVFLDDDDRLLPGGRQAVGELAARHLTTDLFFFNCVHPDGAVSIPREVPPTPIAYTDWLSGRYDAELKPVARRRLFDVYRFEMTGAGGEGLLWGRVIRERGAVVSGEPIIAYDDVIGSARVTSPRGLASRAVANAGIAERWLEEFGADLRQIDAHRWARRVLAAASYRALSGDASRARELIRTVPPDSLSRGRRGLLLAATRLPPRMLATAFVGVRQVLAAARSTRKQPGSLAPGPHRT